MLSSLGGPRRLPRSSLTDRWFGDALAATCWTGAIWFVVDTAFGFLFQFAYGLWEPERAFALDWWWPLPFVVAMMCGAFASRAPLTRGSMLSEILAMMVGLIFGYVALGLMGLL